MLVGYARISTPSQNLDHQMDALKNAGCELIFTDTVTAVRAARPGLKAAMKAMHRGDTLIVCRLDRVARSVKGLIDFVAELEANAIDLKRLV
jgi:DNA invertase Pin-like site-specific DNA recombinase